jgi:pimeloyl-ACP methyl ester carboxylesterase
MGSSGSHAAGVLARAALVRTEIADLPPYGNGTLPPDIRSRAIPGVNGLTVHILEAGYESSGRKAVLHLHGFPELAYSWREVMRPLAAAGYHVIAPDQRGYGRTIGWDGSFDADPDAFGILNLVRDAVCLVFALGYREVAAVVGHDAGSPVAAWSALIRPDIFRSVVMMSVPFAGVLALPFNTANGAAPLRPPQTDDELDAELAKLTPPRKYYQNYQRTPGQTPTCCMRRRACTPFSLPITTTRARTGPATGRIRSRRAPRRRWRRFPPTT